MKPQNYTWAKFSWSYSRLAARPLEVCRSSFVWKWDVLCLKITGKLEFNVKSRLSWVSTDSHFDVRDHFDAEIQSKTKHKMQKQEKDKPTSTKIEKKTFVLNLKRKIKLHTSLDSARNLIYKISEKPAGVTKKKRVASHFSILFEYLQPEILKRIEFKLNYTHSLLSHCLL